MKLTTKLTALAAAALLTASLAGCGSVSTNQTLTYQVDNGEKLKITLDTTDGESLEQKENRPVVKKDDETVLEMAILMPEGYTDKEAAIRGTEGAEIVKDEDGILSCTYDGPAGLEVDYLLKLEGSELGVFLSSLSTQEVADATFAKLSFELTE